MSGPNSAKDMALQDVKPVPSSTSAQHQSIKEGRVTREMPELLRHMSDEEFQVASRKLVRKLDLRLMFPLILMYIMNYLDRSAPEYAICVP